MAFYQWRCAVAAEVTFHGPPEGMRSPSSIYTGYRTSHLRLDGLEHIDCCADVRVLGRDQLRPGETGSVQMAVRLPAEDPDGLADALRVGGGFRLLHVGRRIATGTITALLEPLGALPA